MAVMAEKRIARESTVWDERGAVKKAKAAVKPVKKAKAAVKAVKKQLRRSTA
jgi:hypothetical protein